MQQVEVERDGQWWPGIMGLWRETKGGWVASVRYTAAHKQYREAVPAERLRIIPDES